MSSKVVSNLISLQDASLSFGDKTLWKDVSCDIHAGEFIAVLGANGVGKSSLLKVLLGLQRLDAGFVSVLNKPPHQGNRALGYIPQHKHFDAEMPLRGRDLVQLGIEGHRFGLRHSKHNAERVSQVLSEVDAISFADEPIGLLSGGEQQRLRIAQALVSNPKVLLCDEPFLSLDLASQQTVASLIHEYRVRNKAAVLFVTHEINPILPFVDRILYIANGRWIIDTPDVVLQSKTLSELYGAPVEVLRLHNRVLVVSADGNEGLLIDKHEGHHA